LLARRLGFEPELFEVSDEELAAEALLPGSSGPFPPPQAFDGISLERLRREAIGQAKEELADDELAERLARLEKEDEINRILHDLKAKKGA